jgi:hypothetical protein
MKRFDGYVSAVAEDAERERGGFGWDGLVGLCRTFVDFWLRLRAVLF